MFEVFMGKGVKIRVMKKKARAQAHLEKKAVKRSGFQQKSVFKN